MIKIQFDYMSYHIFRVLILFNFKVEFFNIFIKFKKSTINFVGSVNKYTNKTNFIRKGREKI